MIDKNAYGYYSVKCNLGEMVANGSGSGVNWWVASSLINCGNYSGSSQLPLMMNVTVSAHNTTPHTMMMPVMM